MNPQAIVNMMLKNNPAMQNNPILMNAMNLMNSGNQQALQSLAENLCKNKGLDINQVMQQAQQYFK